MEPKRSSRRGALLWFAAALAVLATALWLRLRGNTAISGPGTPGRYKAEAAPQVAASIVAAQSWQVDDVAGATRTSRAVRKAARDALAEAGWPLA